MPVKKSQGFSLIEMAIVLVIMSMLIGFLVIPLSQQKKNRDVADANKQLEEIKQAVIGFAMANGRLPCPAQLNSNGLEAWSGTQCENNGRGFVPVSSLGLSGRFNCDGLLLDPWNNLYRYSLTSVDTDGDGHTDFAYKPNVQTLNMTGLAPDLHVCSDPACGTQYTDEAVAVIYSMGKDWRTYSSNLQLANAGETGSSPAHSACSNTDFNMPNDNTYIYHEISIKNNQEFDDQLIWIPKTLLYSKMVTAGQLP